MATARTGTTSVATIIVSSTSSRTRRGTRIGGSVAGGRRRCPPGSVGAGSRASSRGPIFERGEAGGPLVASIVRAALVEEAAVNPDRVGGSPLARAELRHGLGREQLVGSSSVSQGRPRSHCRSARRSVKSAFTPRPIFTDTATHVPLAQ